MIVQGTAFPESERERLGIRGLLPTKVTDMKLQACQCLQHTAYGLFPQTIMCHTSFSSLQCDTSPCKLQIPQGSGMHCFVLPSAVLVPTVSYCGDLWPQASVLL